MFGGSGFKHPRIFTYYKRLKIHRRTPKIIDANNEVSSMSDGQDVLGLVWALD